MKRIIILIATIFLLAGCSELKIIGKTAFKEMGVEAVSVEWITYNQVEDDTLYPEKVTPPAARNKKPPVLVGLQKTASSKAVRKGLWEKH